jgi:Ca-activated chloride channel homolog
MALFEFSRWDGTRTFLPLSAASAFDKLAELLLEHGGYLLRQLERMDQSDDAMLEMLLKAGYLERDAAGLIAISPRGLRRIETRALEELFTVARKDAPGTHVADCKGEGPVCNEDVRPYAFGDPVAHLNLHETFKNALSRGGRVTAPRTAAIGLREEDFVVHDTEHHARCATVVLLDMSGSMARYGKFYHAKKVALALRGLVQGRFREDSLQVFGFYTYASPLTERELLLAAPKPVSVFDSRVFLRVPLDDPPADVPAHFTNIHAGLKFARQHLSKQSAVNKQIICITDGEPTAHLEGRDLILMYPPGERTSRATLAEAAACGRAGIQVSTFALVEDYFYLGLVNFVDQMARTARGTAVYCKAGELGCYVLDRFVRGRRSRQRLG